MPDFFIVGAPKCGTTALSKYLREHRNCFMCWPKEPLFFCEDLPGIRQISSFPAYLRLFDSVPIGTCAVGEASAMYLYSRVAVRLLRERFPSARLIVMLRNPIDLVESFHAQLRYALVEDQADLWAAWELQGERARGALLPPHCPEPKLLQYAEVALLGAQVQRVLSVVPITQVHVVVLDDFIRNPRAEYRRVLEFLDLQDDGRSEFSAINSRSAHRLGVLSRLTQRPPRFLVHASTELKRLIGLERIGILDWIRRANRIDGRRRRLPDELRRRMADTFAEDIALLSSLLGRDFSPWLRGERVGMPSRRVPTL